MGERKAGRSRVPAAVRSAASSRSSETISTPVSTRSSRVAPVRVGAEVRYTARRAIAMRAPHRGGGLTLMLLDYAARQAVIARARVLGHNHRRDRAPASPGTSTFVVSLIRSGWK